MPKMAETNPAEFDFVYHVMLMTSQSKGLGGRIGKVRILGTYTSVGKAKDPAHRYLFDGGYEREWFQPFETNPKVLEGRTVSGARNLPFMPLQ